MGGIFFWQGGINMNRIKFNPFIAKCCNELIMGKSELLFREGWSSHSILIGNDNQFVIGKIPQFMEVPKYTGKELQFLQRIHLVIIWWLTYQSTITVQENDSFHGVEFLFSCFS